MPKTAAPPEKAAKVRDRDATERTIVQAAKEVLAAEGFQSFGVNAIARRAGCDKQLIYRYFGGLEGLASSIGADLAQELIVDLTPYASMAPANTYGALMERLLLGLLDLLRRNRLMQQITVWEMALPSPLVERLVEARSRRLSLWMQDMRGALTPPDGLDAPAINAILIASVQQLVLSAAASGSFSGMPLKTDEDWRRAEATLSAIVDAIYGRRS